MGSNDFKRAGELDERVPEDGSERPTSRKLEAELEMEQGLERVAINGPPSQIAVKTGWRSSQGQLTAVFVGAGVSFAGLLGYHVTAGQVQGVVDAGVSVVGMLGALLAVWRQLQAYTNSRGMMYSNSYWATASMNSPLVKNKNLALGAKDLGINYLDKLARATGPDNSDGLGDDPGLAARVDTLYELVMEVHEAVAQGHDKHAAALPPDFLKGVDTLQKLEAALKVKYDELLREPSGRQALKSMQQQISSLDVGVFNQLADMAQEIHRINNILNENEIRPKSASTKAQVPTKASIERDEHPQVSPGPEFAGRSDEAREREADAENDD